MLFRSFLFKAVDVRYRERVPATGPVLLCINHPNNLIDSLLVAAVLRREVHFLATAALFRNPLVARFLLACGAIPVYRKQDEPVARDGVGVVGAERNVDAFSVCNALLINRDPTAPPPFTPWAYTDAGWARLRNRVGYAISDRLTKPISDAVSNYRREWKLPALASPDDSFSRLAQICQMPRAFDDPVPDAEPLRLEGPERRLDVVCGKRLRQG